MPADGSQVNFEFSFAGGYIDPSHIAVTVIDASGIETLAAFTLAGPSTVRVTTAPPAGTKVRIRRLTPTDNPLVNFANGAVVTEENLDLIAKQAVLAAADAADSGLIAVQDLRNDAVGFKLWASTSMASWLKDALTALLLPTFRGPKGDPGTQGIQGLQGPEGIKGDTGNPGTSPNIQIGTVTTTAPGTNATANLTGSFPNLLLNLGLPRGNTGTVNITGSGAGIWGAITGNLTDQADLVSALGAKADTSALANLATQTYVNNAVSTKANISALAPYALLTDLATGLATKADHDDLLVYARSADMTTALAAKANTTALASYVLTTDLNATLSAYATQASLSTYATKTYVDNAVAAGVSSALSVTSFTTARSIANADDNTLLRFTGGTARTITLANITAGVAVILVNRGTVSLTLSASSGMYKNGASITATTATLAKGGQVTLIHEGSGVWSVTGSGLT